MGFFFPMGLRLVKSSDPAEAPWYWAVNGTFGVLCSALAVFVAIYSGISTNFYLAAFCYAALLACIHLMTKTGDVRPARRAGK